MGLFNRLFGGKGDVAGSARSTPAHSSVEYKGFAIRPEPRAEGGQYLVAGVIEKEIGGVVRQHRFVRADRSPDRDEIAEMALTKARLIIDQQGDAIFT